MLKVADASRIHPLSHGHPPSRAFTVNIEPETGPGWPDCFLARQHTHFLWSGDFACSFAVCHLEQRAQRLVGECKHLGPSGIKVGSGEFDTLKKVLL
jgi:hypothetical protein